MNDVTKQLVLELSADLFRDAIKVHYQNGVAEGTSLNFHNIARDSVQAAHSFYRVANQELYTAGAGSATQREAYWWAHSNGYEQGAKGLPFNEPEMQALYEGQPELFDAYANGWHAGDMKRAAHLAAQNRSH